MIPDTRGTWAVFDAKLGAGREDVSEVELPVIAWSSDGKPLIWPGDNCKELRDASSHVGFLRLSWPESVTK